MPIAAPTLDALIHDTTPPRPPLLSLTDSQMDMVMQAAAPLAVDRRSAFLNAVAAELRHRPEIGAGELYRLLAMLQRQYFHPPDLSKGKNYSRWR